MTDITVKHDPASGTATIEIRGAKPIEARFRLRNPSSEKYLTKRGWTKTAAFLPSEATTTDDVIAIAIDADLARKIPANALLSLEQPAAAFQEAFTWPEAATAPVVPAAAISSAAVAEDAKPEIDHPETLEPSIMDEHLHPDPDPIPTEDRTKSDPFAANDDQRSSWAPAAIAAALFFVLGLGLSYLLFATNDSAAVKEAQQAATIQIEKERWEFQRQLTEAREQASAASLDKVKASSAEVKQLAADRDKALKALADKEAGLKSLESKLADANSQIEAVKNSAGDAAKAQIAVLDGKIASLGGKLDKTNEELARRDQLLRDTQAKLTEATDQVAAVKDAAQKEAEALNDDLTEKTDGLNVQIEQLKKQLTAREQKLRETEAALAAARESAQSAAQSQSTALTSRIDQLTAELKQGEQQIAERDKSLRDAQAKLSVANVQIDALKLVAGKSAEADLEKTALGDKVVKLTADLDKAGKDLADREKALGEATGKLRDADERLAAANARIEELGSAQPGDQASNDPADNEPVNRLQEERDLYANELKTLTGNFTALQAEKAELQKTIADLQGEMKDASVTPSQLTSKAIWGATAIDQTGTIYALQNQTAQKAAEDNVTAICRGKSKYRCEALATYQNACFSVARFEGEGPAADNYAYFVHKDWKTSARVALERCESQGASCTVRFTACSPDALSKPVSD